MNSVNLTGRWVADITSTKVGEKTKATGRIAVDRIGKDAPSDFFEVELWEKQAEVAAAYCKKGDFAIVSGRLAQDTWEKDGDKRSKVYIKAERIDLPPRSMSAGGAEKSENPAPKAKKTAPVDDDDIPF